MNYHIVTGSRYVTGPHPNGGFALYELTRLTGLFYVVRPTEFAETERVQTTKLQDTEYFLVSDNALAHGGWPEPGPLDYGPEETEPEEFCGQCGAAVVGHHACRGVPGWEEGQ